MTAASRPVFRLPTLDLSSGFETPVVPAAVPYEVGSGADPALAVVEGAYRPAGSVCRFVQPRGLVAVRFADPLPAVLRVVFALRSDRYSDDRWTERAERLALARVVRGVDRAPAPQVDPVRRTRLVGIEVNGLPRAAVLLVNDGSEDGFTRQRVVLDVARDELQSGMLLLGFGPSALPALPVPDLLDDALVGVCLTRLRFAVSDGLARGSVSTGALADDDGWLPYLAPGALVSPPANGQPVRLEARTAARAGLRRRSDAPAVAVRDSTGAPVTVTPATGGDGLTAYDLPGDRGVLVASFDVSGPLALRMGPPPASTIL